MTTSTTLYTQNLQDEVEKLKSIIRSALTAVEVLGTLVKGDPVLEKLLPGLSGIEAEMREAIK